MVCAACGKLFHGKPSHFKRFKGKEGFFCSRECAKVGMRLRMTGENNHQYGLRGSLNASYKGNEIQKRNNSLSETLVYVPNHPFADKNQRITKHRLVVEQNAHLFDGKWFVEIGGKPYLSKCAIVHHKNGDHSDNRVENLEILTRGQHTHLHNKECYNIIHRKTGRIAARVRLPVANVEFVKELSIKNIYDND